MNVTFLWGSFDLDFFLFDWEPERDDGFTFLYLGLDFCFLFLLLRLYLFLRVWLFVFLGERGLRVRIVPPPRAAPPGFITTICLTPSSLAS